MATVNQIRKQVETAEKAVSKTEKVYRIQTRNFGAVAWRMYDKIEYPEKVAISLVAKLNQVDPIHCFRKVRIR